MFLLGIPILAHLLGLADNAFFCCLSLYMEWLRMAEYDDYIALGYHYKPNRNWILTWMFSDRRVHISFVLYRGEFTLSLINYPMIFALYPPYM